jgi:[protein-PII] uridylyltransferase
LTRKAPGEVTHRARLEAVRRELAERFRRRRDAAPLLAALSRSVDRILRELWAGQGAALDRACLLATGGYGRGELYPGSDVDILVLVPEGRDTALDAAVRAFLASCWDAGLELAQAVRTVANVREFASEDLAGYTALLDARKLAGDPVLAAALLDWVQGPEPWPPARFLAGKRAESEERHHRHADTAHNLEPNLKQGRGALRDLQTALWIARRCVDAGSPGELVAAGLLEAEEATRLARAGRWLATLRYALHTVSGRREERVLFDHQVALARLFELDRGPTPHQAVEALMQRYFRAAGDIDRLASALVARIARRLRTEFGEDVALPGTHRHVLRDGMLEAAASDRGFEAPSDLVEPFLVMARNPQIPGLGPDLAQALARALPGQKRALAHDRLAHDAFEAVLATRRPHAALAEMHRHGVLGALLPAFARVSGRMQYDLFHVYTVDQHTLFLVRNLERFFVGPTDEAFALAHELAQRVRQPELMFYAAIFHDIAKGRGGDHSLLGAADARRYLHRRGLAHADIELVAWLVEHHLLMSTTAQKQDIQDPETVRRFATAVGDWERLECLYLLTVADIRATNPKLWNGWKARLLGDLYQATRLQLRRGVDKPLDRDDRVRATRLKALELLTSAGSQFSAVEAIWADFPDQGFWRYTPDQLRWLTQSILAGGRPGKPLIAVRSVGHGGTREIFVRMADQDGIFATLTAQLDRMDLSVIAARVMTCKSGLTLDTFQVLDLRREEQDAMTRNQEIRIGLELALAEQPLKPRLARRRATREQTLFRFPLQIAFEVRPDVAGTQLMLVCPDRPGLLASVAFAFRDAGVRVHSARIATFGERAEDFFTVTDAGGHALDDATKDRLREALAARVSEN